MGRKRRGREKNEGRTYGRDGTDGRADGADGTRTDGWTARTGGRREGAKSEEEGGTARRPNPNAAGQLLRRNTSQLLSCRGRGAGTRKWQERMA